MGNHQLQHGLARDNLGHIVMMGPRCDGGQDGKYPKLLDEAMQAIQAVYRRKLGDNLEEEKDGERKKQVDDEDEETQAKRKKEEK